MAAGLTTRPSEVADLVAPVEAAEEAPGDPVTPPLLLASALMGVGLWLHLSERHDPEHVHKVAEHEHSHVHDEHHQHHDGLVTEPHSHRHRHEPLRHQHPHYPDLHHRHEHG